MYELLKFLASILAAMIGGFIGIVLGVIVGWAAWKTLCFLDKLQKRLFKC